MHHWLLVIRDLLHLLWFVSPLLFAFGFAGAWADDSRDNEAGIYFWLMIMSQTSIVIGYLNGYNVQ